MSVTVKTVQIRPKNIATISILLGAGLNWSTVKAAKKPAKIPITIILISPYVFPETT